MRENDYYAMWDSPPFRMKKHPDDSDWEKQLFRPSGMQPFCPNGRSKGWWSPAVRHSHTQHLGSYTWRGERNLGAYQRGIVTFI